MTNEKAKKRYDSIDMIKGLSILTLFFLHFENGVLNTDFLIVRSQAFYLVVGWLWGMSANKRTAKQHWGKRLHGLVIPYLWFSLIFLTLDIIFILLDLYSTDILLRDIYKTICLRGIGTLWFLPALLLGEFIFIFARDNKAIRIVLLTLSIAIMYLYGYLPRLFESTTIYKLVDAPTQVVVRSFSAFFYITIAYYTSSNIGTKVLKSKKWQLFLIGLILLFIGYWVSSKLNLAPLYGTILFILRNVLSGFGVFFIFHSIQHCKPLASPLVYFGKNSLIVMSMHWLLFLIFIEINKHLLGYNSYSGVQTIIYFIISLFLMAGIIELINRKLKFLIGK